MEADLRVVACVLLEMALSFLGILTNLLGQSGHSTVQHSTVQYSTVSSPTSLVSSGHILRLEAGQETRLMKCTTQNYAQLRLTFGIGEIDLFATTTKVGVLGK